MEHLQAVHGFLQANKDSDMSTFAALSSTQARSFITHMRDQVHKSGSALDLVLASSLLKEVAQGPWGPEEKILL